MSSRTAILAMLLIILLTSSISEQGWNVGTLKEYIDSRFEAIELAILKQENAYNERFANTNEWRNSYDDLITVMQRDFLPRNEFSLLKDDVNAIKQRQDKIENMKAGGNVVYAYVASAISMIIALISFGIMVYRVNMLKQKS